MKLRNIPVLLQHYTKGNSAPEAMALGFAAHILFMKCEEESGKYYGNLDGNKYLVQDDKASLYAEKWQQAGNEGIVNAVLADQGLWEADLTTLPGFADLVATKLTALQNGGIMKALNEVQTENELA